MTVRMHGFRAVLLVLAAMTTSCGGTRDVDVTPVANTSVDAHVGKSMTSDSTRIENVTKDFGPNDVVYAIVDIPGKIEGTVKARWLLSTGEVVQEHVTTLQDGINVYRFRLIPPASGHRTGIYSLEIYVNDNRAETESFQVQSG